MKPGARQRRILVCNDDGVYGVGLRPLIAAMRRLGAVTAVVPAQERSADSHALTLHKPIRVFRAEPGLYTINGRPADCARLGALEIMGGKVDLVVSGINRGYNLGEDVVYSGTVAAAREATLLELPAIAFSQDPRSRSYAPSAAFAARLARLVLERGLPKGVCLSVNFPWARRGRLKSARLCRLGRRLYSKRVTLRRDPRGEHYYWLAGGTVTSVEEPGTDVYAVSQGHVSVTPLQLDSTDHGTLAQLRDWPFLEG